MQRSGSDRQRSRCVRPDPALHACSPRPRSSRAIAAATAGCQTTQTADTTGSLALAPADRSDADWRRDVEVYGQQYRANPTDVDVALRYAQALRGTGQRAQAVAVLEQISIQNPNNKVVLGEYGRALAESRRL